MECSTVRYCPVTGNRPIKVTPAGFSAACEKFQLNAVVRKFPYSDFCNICGGAEIPAEVEFIDLAKMMEGKEMAGPKVSTGTCDLCGERKQVRSVRNKSCCGTCEGIWRNALNAPQLVVAALVEAQGQAWLDGKCSSIIANEAQDENMQAELQLAEEKLRKLDDARRREVQELALWLFREDEEIPAVWNLTERVIRMAKHNAVLAGKNDTMAMKVFEAESAIVKLRDQLAEVTATPAEMINHNVGESASRDAAILDLAIDVIAGRVSGVTAERLQALR